MEKERMIATNMIDFKQEFDYLQEVSRMIECERVEIAVNDADEHGYTDAEFGLMLRKMATLIAAGRI